MTAEREHFNEVESLFKDKSVLESNNDFFRHLIKDAIYGGNHAGVFRSDNLSELGVNNGLVEYVPGETPFTSINWGASFNYRFGELKANRKLKNVKPSIWIVSDILNPVNQNTLGKNTIRSLGALTIFGFANAYIQQGFPVGTILTNGMGGYFDQFTENSKSRLNNVAGKLVQLARIEDGQPDPDESMLYKVLRKASSKIEDKSMIILVSRFRNDQSSEWQKAAKGLIRSGNSILGVQIKHEIDDKLPEEVDSFYMPESGKVFSIGGKKYRGHIAEAYETNAKTVQTGIESVFKAGNARLVTLSTESGDWQQQLKNGLAGSDQ